VGGAAFITALAAKVCGARAGLVARVPRTIPADVARAFAPGGLERAGLQQRDGVLPSFQIAYDAEHNASYGEFDPGLERELCAADFPEQWLAGVRVVHIASLAGDALLQLQFVADLRARGYRGLLSAGTYQRMVEAQPEQVGELLLCSDFFFCNAREAQMLVPDGPPATWEGMLCVTDGGRGVRCFSHGQVQSYPAPALEVVDATGAGDAFCGAFLGAVATGAPPVAAGLSIAGQVLSGIGARPLLEHIERDTRPRVQMNSGRVATLAAALSEVAVASDLTFCGFPFPEAGDPLALENLAAATLHQYGFWDADDRGWTGPMYASREGRRFKGSDWIWQAFTRAAQADPSVFDPGRMADEPRLVEQMCLDEEGNCPLPGLESHCALHQAYGAALVERFPRGFIDLLEKVRACPEPAAALLDELSRLPGYAEDPLAKKANLLVVMLAARPEGFLPLRDPQSIRPIVDYHLMRGCLRTGCVEILDSDLRKRIESRQWVDCEEEREIRAVSFAAIEELVRLSKRSIASVDGFFFSNGRSRCLEDQEPRCEECPVRDSCARETLLFQPIYRTTSY
jgi:sugar/nucleoside kinase (ribokinase family)